MRGGTKRRVGGHFMGIARARSAALAMLAMLALGGSQPWGAAATASADEAPQALSLSPARVATVSQDRCGAPTLSTAGTNCVAFDGREVRSQPDIFVVGFENDQDQNEK